MFRFLETLYWGKKLEWRTSQLGGLADPVSSRGSLQRTATVLQSRSNPDSYPLDVLSNFTCLGSGRLKEVPYNLKASARPLTALWTLSTCS